MGATRESSCSVGIFAAWPCGAAACIERGDGIYACVSPGIRTVAHIIASKYRSVAPENLWFGFMATSAIDRPLEPGQSIEHACAHRFTSVHDMRIRSLT